MKTFKKQKNGEYTLKYNHFNKFIYIPQQSEFNINLYGAFFMKSLCKFDRTILVSNGAYYIVDKDLRAAIEHYIHNNEFQLAVKLFNDSNSEVRYEFR